MLKNKKERKQTKKEEKTNVWRPNRIKLFKTNKTSTKFNNK